VAYIGLVVETIPAKTNYLLSNLRLNSSPATHRSSLASLHSHISSVTLSTLERNQRITGLFSTPFIGVCVHVDIHKTLRAMRLTNQIAHMLQEWN